MHLVFALSLTGQLQKIGSYAGLVAIPGLAVLALLYFAQAREVRRLREWAGRAPERAQELQDRVSTQAAGQAPARTGQVPVERRVVAAPVATPGQKTQPPAAPAPAVAGAPAAKPAPGLPIPPSSAPAAPAAKPGAPVPAAAPAKPGAAPAPATAAAGALPASKPSAPVPAQAPRTGTAAGQARPAAQPLRATPASATAAPRRAAAPARRGAGGSAAGRSGPPRNALIAGGVVAGLIVIVLLVTQVFGGGGGGKKQVNRAGPASAAQTSASIKSTPSAAPVNRAGATIAVLNGTTVPGLAAQVADQLEKSGFKRGQVTNAADQQRSTTTIAYAPGFGAAAKEVVSVLKLRKADPIDANTQAIAGPDASIVVTVGTDRTQ